MTPVETHREQQAAGDIASALESLVERSGPRSYRLREVAVVLGTFALVMALFDADALVTWARRMEVGPAQTAWLWALTPLRTADEALGFTTPRRALVAAADRLGHAMGAGEDPLFAQAWRADPQDAPPEPPPPALADVEAALALDDIAEPAPGVPVLEPSPEPAAEMAMAPGAAPRTVLLIGDSLMAGSLGSAVTRALSTDPRYRVVEAAQTATGLSRPDVFDWGQVVPLLLEREHPRFIVCSFGANDAVPMREGARTLDFWEPRWRAAYRARVVRMMAALAGSDARVLWLGLPPMRDKHFAERTKGLNRLFASAARSVPRVEYLEVNMLLSDSGGDFATFATDSSGHYTRLRMDDGVHYSPGGARLVSRWIVDWLRERTRMAQVTK